MSITDWLFSTCGSSHIGIYICSRCGYQLVRSGLGRSSLIKKYGLGIASLLPPSTIAARGKSAEGKENGGEGSGDEGRISFDSKAMLGDFSKNANLGRVFHKDSILKRILEGPEVEECGNPKRYQISCGKCGSSLGHQIQDGEGHSKFEIKPKRVDLIFRAS